MHMHLFKDIDKIYSFEHRLNLKLFTCKNSYTIFFGPKSSYSLYTNVTNNET